MSAIAIIRTEMEKIVEYLFVTHNMGIRERQEVQYGIKYEVINQQTLQSGVLVLYYGKKKGFSFVQEKKSAELSIVEDIFLNHRDSLVNTKVVTDQQNSPKKPDYAYLHKLYSSLKPYEQEDFDFSVFANELKSQCGNEVDKQIIEENKYKFLVLESFYEKLIGK